MVAPLALGAGLAGFKKKQEGTLVLRVLDLFSGIGGFSLGLERTGGFKTVAFCEIEPFPRRVLAKHWPEVPCYDDVRTLTADRLASDGIAVDVICGGFPCQDISVAGKGAGIADGTRSGLWSEIARLACELRPQFLIVENVSALLSRGLDRVLGDLAEIGFDAEWHCIPASSVGAPHRRDRFWLVAYANNCGWDFPELHQPEAFQQHEAIRTSALADANSPRLQVAWPEPLCEDWKQGWRLPATSGWWAVEPDVGRVAHGVPSRVDRLRALGNAVVPQIPELIGHAILQSIRETEL